MRQSQWTFANGGRARFPVLFLFVFLFSGLFACTQQRPSGGEQSDGPAMRGESDRQAVQTLLEKYYLTMSDRDWERYRSFFWEDATLTTAWQRPGEDSSAVHVATIDEFIAGTAQGPDSQPIFEERMLSSTVDVRDSLAVAWTRYAAKFGTEGNLQEWEGTDLFTLMKHGGEWRIVSLAYRSD